MHSVKEESGNYVNKYLLLKEICRIANQT
jgi:hypothetical protein